VLGDFCHVATVANPVCGGYEGQLRAAGVRMAPGLAALQAASPRSRTPAGLLVSAVPGSRKLLSLFTCGDWKRANEAARTGVLRRLAEFTGGHVVANGVDGWGTSLTDQQGRKFLDQRCSSGLPDSIALYKMYGYAAGFAGSLRSVGG
jgi:hypothetical protein